MDRAPEGKATDGKGRRSPAMQQFFRAKAAYPDAILFFRMGDFYEMFFEDAVLGAELLDIALTSRSKDAGGESIPMAGVPHHAASSYIAKLLEKGRKVAICEQMADPSKVRGIVPREVVRVVTPGLVLDPDALDARAHNFVAAVVKSERGWAIATLELTTAEARACEVGDDVQLIAELVRLDPREILIGDDAGALCDACARVLPRSAIRVIRQHRSDDLLTEVLGADGAKDAENSLSRAERRAALEVLAYGRDAQPGQSLGVSRVSRYEPGRHLALDDAAVRNLEILRTLRGEKKGSLLALIDQTRTPMGARLLRRWVLAPLTDVPAIRRRHDHVEAFANDHGTRTELRRALAQVGDLERLTTRAALGVATPRDLGALRDGLAAAQRASLCLTGSVPTDVAVPLAAMAPADRVGDLAERLSRSLREELPLSTGQGPVFREGVDAEIDELRALSASSKDVLLALEERERQRTGVHSLKIRYTKVFGYYLEITRANLKAVPPEYRRKQTVAGAERFTTEELEALEDKILHADEKLRERESSLFFELRAEVAVMGPRLRALAAQIAEIDALSNFAEVAAHRSWVRPVVDESRSLDLVDARHPMVEDLIPSGTFVPNDVALDADGLRLMIVTGPNMAGKSTAMRQTVLAVILAQAGSFVPASRARIGIVDRIYTRVGASDDLSAGLSTFMVEMRETATILRGATSRSLVVLDEIGRGTSTYDGMAIAWAVAEHLHDVAKCRAMFATHYHELCALASQREGVINMNVEAREHQGDVVFLHRLARGPASRSYGIAVAKLAGVPEIVLARARALLSDLEEDGNLPSGAHIDRHTAEARPQLALFGEAGAPKPSPVEETLRAIDIERLTPIDAMLALVQLKRLLPSM